MFVDHSEEQYIFSSLITIERKYAINPSRDWSLWVLYGGKDNKKFFLLLLC